MEIITELQNQLILIVPVGLAVLACVLVFTYSLRPAQQPTFNISSFDDRKTAGKKKKLKEKKSTPNGVATAVAKSEKSPAKEQKKSPESSKKEKKVETSPKEVKKSDAPKKVSEPQEPKKKGNKKANLEKPADFDDGGWETIPIKSKADKKKKAEQPSVKKEKKGKVQSEVSQPEVLEPVVQAAFKEESPEKEEEIPIVVAESEPEPEEIVEDEPEPEVIVEKAIEAKVPVVEAKKDKKKNKPEVVVEEPIEEPAPVVEEKKDKKKKKPKASKVLKPEVAEEVVPEAAPETVAASVEQPKSAPAATSAPSGAAFDELGDTWTEAKPVKKSKKKARRDN